MKTWKNLFPMLCLLLILCACGEKPQEAHVHRFSGWSTAVRSTCTEAGWLERVCECGEIEKKAAGLKEHIAGAWITEAATAVQAGRRYQPCTTCGVALKEDVIPAGTVGSYGLAYAVNEDGITCTITGIGSCVDAEVEVPDVIGEYRVTAVKEWAFQMCTQLVAVTVPTGVTEIGGSAFYGCTNLQRITIPEGVTVISEYLLAGCSSLIRVALPNSITAIERGAFDSCIALKALAIPNGVTELGDGVFQHCASLKSIAIPDGVTKLGNSVFERCENLQAVTYSNYVTQIGNHAFYRCERLRRLDIPASVTELGERVFGETESLERIDFQGTLEEWSRIRKRYPAWEYNGAKYFVYCSDGIVEKD